MKWLAPVFFTVSFELPLSLVGSVAGYYSLSIDFTDANDSGMPRASMSRYPRGVQPAFGNTSRTKRYGKDLLLVSLFVSLFLVLICA